jgi:hypothetical protein
VGPKFTKLNFLLGAAQQEGQGDRVARVVGEAVLAGDHAGARRAVEVKDVAGRDDAEGV